MLAVTQISDTAANVWPAVIAVMVAAGLGSIGLLLKYYLRNPIDELVKEIRASNHRIDALSRWRDYHVERTHGFASPPRRTDDPPGTTYYHERATDHKE